MPIESRQNRRVKGIRRLRDCKERLAFLEGPHLLAELAGSDLEIEELVATPEFVEGRQGHLVDSVQAEPLLVSARVLASLVDAASPQGVLTVVRLPREGVSGLPVTSGGVYLYLEALQDPGNLGALARSAEAAGAAGIALGPGSAHPSHPKALRASAGSLLRLPTATGCSVDGMLEHLASASPRLVGLDSRGGSDLYETPLAGTLVLALGSEGAGLTPALRSEAEMLVSVPTAAQVESLNVTVAASVVLHELARRRRESRSAHEARPT